jgi:hypothetical protein
MQMRGAVRVFLMIAGVAALSALADSQSAPLPDLSNSAPANSIVSVAPPFPAEPKAEADSAETSTVTLDPAYVPPTAKEKGRAYLSSTVGIYSILGNGFASGINQAYDSPPEWKQGAAGYAKRFGSNFGIGTINTTTRYALAEAFKEDDFYYNCECRGFFRRLRHAAFSSLTARRGDDGHVVFSVPSLVAPYVGSAVGVYAWYPDRFGAKDWFRMGNYLLLQSAGLNIGMEFLARGPHSLLGRMHMSGRTASGTNR